MTGPDSDPEDTKQVSVAELLARNGSIGGPMPSRRRRRRRGDDSVSVAELTGEIPIIRDDHPAPPARSSHEDAGANGGVQVATPPPPPSTPVVQPPVPAPKALAEPVVADTVAPPSRPESSSGTKSAYWSEPEPRWPRSEPLTKRRSGPERSEYPRPLRQPDTGAADGQQSGAEGMSPDPVGHYTDASVDVMDSEVREAESAVEDSAFVRSYLQGADDAAAGNTLFGGGQSIADEVARRRGEQTRYDDADGSGAEDEERSARSGGAMAALGRGALTVLQSVLAVAFGGGLFIAFDQLWRWNSIVALVLSVLVILGLVVGVRVVRKTEDIASTLIAVAVGALITLGPMALLQAG